MIQFSQSCGFQSVMTLKFFGLEIKFQRMKVLIYHRHRFPSDIIRRAVWLYYRLALSG